MWALILLKSLHNIRGLHNFNPTSKSIEMQEQLWEFIMIINLHVAKKAMKKEAKRKARIEQKRAKKLKDSPTVKKEDKMHDIDKPITLEDLTNPDSS